MNEKKKNSFMFLKLKTALRRLPHLLHILHNSVNTKYKKSLLETGTVLYR